MSETIAFDTSARDISASGKSGGTCQTSGPYTSSRTPSIVVFLARGQKFPNDPVSGSSTTWNLVTSTRSVSTSETVV
jgi:hypothetical protein